MDGDYILLNVHVVIAILLYESVKLSNRGISENSAEVAGIIDQNDMVLHFVCEDHRQLPRYRGVLCAAPSMYPAVMGIQPKDCRLMNLCKNRRQMRGAVTEKRSNITYT